MNPGDIPLQHRELGFYWIKYKGDWIVGQFTETYDPEDPGSWAIPGSDDALDDSAFDLINEIRLTAPQ